MTKLAVKMLEIYGYGNQNRTADMLGINRSRMSAYVTGLTKIPAHHLLVLSKAMKCHPADLVGYQEMESV
jgi:DNA-binding transcriptional regulator YdaS (Cro superfamily)